ncbi:MAG: 4'-phosphopantetheinyl transferase family protein [Angustibacter sp.]
MFQELLPASVAVVERTDDLSDPQVHIDPSLLQHQATEPAVRRQLEFATGRWCAQAALRRLQVPPTPIPRNADRSPRWPPGVIGSITHCTGMRAAAVTRAGELRGLGIDAEPDVPLPDGVLRLIATTEDRASLAALTTRASGQSPTEPHGDRLLFSAKEAVFKAWYPLTGHWLDFTDADLELCADGRFEVHLRVPWPSHIRGLPRWTGRWSAVDGLLRTVAVLS